MKKLVLILAAVFMVGIVAIQAQQRDTTRTRDVGKDMVRIEASELPVPVQDALKAQQYSGWQSGEIYRNRSSEQFLVMIGDGDRAKRYYFDTKGKPIKDN